MGVSGAAAAATDAGRTFPLLQEKHSRQKTAAAAGKNVRLKFIS
jgi:hypothetical protein